MTARAWIAVRGNPIPTTRRAPSVRAASAARVAPIACPPRPPRSRAAPRSSRWPPARGGEAAGHDSSNVDYQAANQVKEVAATSVVGDGGSGSPQVVNPNSPASLDQFNDILAKGKQYAADMAQAEASKYRPLWTKFTAAGTFTSGFGIRWGVAHQGVDIAAPIGTPIYAVADGTVLEAGPASGFGMWVRLLHDDGTVTIYGHIDTTTVSQGQRVMAGDQIATVGNRGFSTGPHCHFEVWLNGVDKIDPLPWLASRGISLGPERD
ncbi:M23 family metallopeptidase [Nocardia seriolae]|uniref:M23 family metallopeptidase n=1 Tax=Nocardia seriolae TaxID=37332 RepID=UPI0039B0F153